MLKTIKISLWKIKRVRRLKDYFLAFTSYLLKRNFKTLNPLKGLQSLKTFFLLNKFFLFSINII
ncbi:hypothetical protein B6S12_00795 [Helicobacter valdiviensis]|uniref:Uncharacterized protein n=1 Tax=Helicobacter valdiviensis TaxID=1458358 RepID=A0A2W6PR31_9HELI|nr:hypothetical protein B6S12_00795 [Helicobacter valdiviensis]